MTYDVLPVEGGLAVMQAGLSIGCRIARRILSGINSDGRAIAAITFGRMAFRDSIGRSSVI
jgi:hypothetical protein